MVKFNAAADSDKLTAAYVAPRILPYLRMHPTREQFCGLEHAISYSREPPVL